MFPVGWLFMFNEIAFEAEDHVNNASSEVVKGTKFAPDFFINFAKLMDITFE